MEVLGDDRARKYVSGIAIHWYVDTIVSATVLNTTHSLFPDYFLLGTEACEGFYFSMIYNDNFLSIKSCGNRFSSFARASLDGMGSAPCDFGALDAGGKLHARHNHRINRFKLRNKPVFTLVLIDECFSM